ncbi:MAG TPA: F0F1 ATP synthase subunit gamma [Xanthobacteraceae bacterium]|jgi:F-type H+-transporting ATPase subunit gamma|nr:F0F1 ATP synthase subunit gamma [Xanthobacteraceae bacterium]
MPSLKDLRNRIASTKATQKITKAMQMVAASKLRRAQVAAEAARPYAERMDKVLGHIAATMAGVESVPPLLRGTGSDNVHLLLVCTAERGLCGPFNSAIVRLARERANSLIAQGKQVKFFCVGRKGYEQLKRQYERLIIEHIELRAVRTLAFSNAEEIAERILRLYAEGAFDVCTLIFARFKSVIAQVQTAQQIIPPVFEGSPHPNPPPGEGMGGGTGAVYEYEPDEEEILTQILPRNIAVQIFRALLENNASFYGAQMSAMDNATRNAGEMIRKQTLKYNRTRQAMITKELIEIISGAEAL